MKIRKIISNVVFYIGLGCAGMATAESVIQPVFNEGDSWTYKVSTEKGQSWSQVRQEYKITRATEKNLFYSLKVIDSPNPVVNRISGIDWSVVRDVNGKETTVNQPLNFPLSVGKGWKVKYTELNPSSNKTHKSEEWIHNYKVIKLESIRVPAGEFMAYKIEDDGEWIAQINASSGVSQGAVNNPGNITMVTQIQKNDSRTATGKVYKAFWYAPEVKRWVKAIEEYYGNGGTMNERYTSELESFSVN